MSANLRAKIAAHVGPLAIDVELFLEEKTLVLAGPNGAGKSTILAMLLGLRRPESGSISFGGELLFDAQKQIDREPELRGFGWVPQGESLFPHLTALGNVELGIEARRPNLKKNQLREKARSLLAQLESSELSDRMPRDLSGGERQRITLARALASEPRALLLDEPLSALDANARPAVRDFLLRTLDSLKLPTILVTHDPEDAAALAKTIAILEQGRITQFGALAELRERPRTPFVQTFVK